MKNTVWVLVIALNHNVQHIKDRDPTWGVSAQWLLLLTLPIDTPVYGISNLPMLQSWVSKAMEALWVLWLLSCLDTVIVKVEVLSSLQRKAPPSLKTCSFHWDLTHRDLFARVSWLSMPEILSWAFQPDPNAFRADSEARVLFRTSAILWVCWVSHFPCWITLPFIYSIAER